MPGGYMRRHRLPLPLAAPALLAASPTGRMPSVAFGTPHGASLGPTCSFGLRSAGFGVQILPCFMNDPGQNS